MMGAMKKVDFYRVQKLSHKCNVTNQGLRDGGTNQMHNKMEKTCEANKKKESLGE
jgi:hypothetical protein